MRNQYRWIVPLLGLPLLLTGAAEAAQVNWQTDFRDAVSQAGRLKKPLLVEITAEWCGYCRKMVGTFADERIARRVNDCFIPVSVDADENARLVKAIGVEGLPTTVIISPELKIVKKIAGYQTPVELGKHLEDLCPGDRTDRRGSDPAPTAARRHGQPFGFGGVCLVSLLEEQKLIDGSPGHTAIYRGTTLAFASAEHKRRFESHPHKYWPALDGHCIVSAADTDTVRRGSPASAVVYDGRLWFFADDAHRRHFATAPAHYARLATALAAAPVSPNISDRRTE